MKNSCFKVNIAIFSENYLKQYAGGVRSLEFTNVRIHTNEGWRDVTSTNYIHSRVTKTGVLADICGSWDARADDSTFYMISTGVPGWGRTENTGKLTVQNRGERRPLNGKSLKETVRFDDMPASAVPGSQYYAAAVQWAKEQGLLDGAFSNVPASAGYAGAVRWVVERGVTSGASTDQFAPGRSCTWGQIVTIPVPGTGRITDNCLHRLYRENTIDRELWNFKRSSKLLFEQIYNNVQNSGKSNNYAVAYVNLDESDTDEEKVQMIAYSNSWRMIKTPALSDT